MALLVPGPNPIASANAGRPRSCLSSALGPAWLRSSLGGISRHLSMSHSIISDSEALQILKNDLRRLAVEKHATELNNATPERRSEVMAQIDRDIQKELRKRKRSIIIDPSFFH